MRSLIQKGRAWRPYGKAVLCSVLYFLPFLRLLSHQGDEGTLIGGATRVLAGQLPYRDFFEVMGPGTFYWLALFFKLLGTTWFATRACLLLTTTGITVALYYLARRLNLEKAGWPAILFVAACCHRWNVISHHMDSTLWALLSFTALANWLQRPRCGLLLLAGAGAGLTSCFMLQKGALLCLAFVIVIFLLDNVNQRWRAMLTVVGGYALVLLIVSALFWRAGGLADLLQANLLWPMAHYTGVNSVPYGLEFRQVYWDTFTTAFSALGPQWFANGISAFLSLPFVFVLGLPLLLAALGWTYGRSAFDRAALPYWVAGSALWLSEIHRKDLPHLVFGSPLLILLAFHLYGRSTVVWARDARRLLVVSAYCLAAVMPLTALLATRSVTTPRGVIRNAAEEDHALQFLNTHVQPGDPIYVYPYANLYYFLSGTSNPTRYTILMYQMNSGEQFRETIGRLEQDQVRYVVWNRTFPQWINQFFPAYRNPPANELIMEPYLLEHYTPVGGDADGFQVLERKNRLAEQVLLEARRSAAISRDMR